MILRTRRGSRSADARHAALSRHVVAESASNMPNLLLLLLQVRNRLQIVGSYDMPFALEIDSQQQ
jgi:hypothetical protein